MNLSERRKQNLYWTVSGNYQRKYSGANDFYSIIEQGIIDLLFPKNQLENFIRKNISHLSNKEDLEAVVRIMAKEWVKKTQYKLRPGAKKYEIPFYQNIFHIEDKKRKRAFKEEIFYQYARFRLSKPLTCGPILSPIFKEVLQVEKCSDSKEFFRKVVKIFDKYFHVNANFVDEEIVVDVVDIEEIEKKQIKTKEKRKVLERKNKTEELDIEEIQSAEFTNVIRDTSQLPKEEEGQISVSSKSADKAFERVKIHFGKQELSRLKIESLERDLATGVHEGMKLHVSKGSFDNDINSKYFEEKVALQRQKNLHAFKEDEHHYRRTIFELREILRKDLIEDFDSSEWKSESGRIDPSLIWRHTIFGEEQIFLKNQFDKEGSFSVDILLDMSASQQSRQPEVAIQGFLIAEALVDLGIPTRVMGFCNLFHYQILRIFRDYKEDKKQNWEIFDYKASGSNRDGFALKYVFETMKDVEAETQILIVLSDGKPNDHIHLGNSYLAVDVADYEGDMAIYDTASEILHGRVQNKAILGVFTGVEEDLDQEKKIFGHDFVRITDLSRFSTIVGKYLKSVIERL